CQHGYGIPCTF
nr:immunoglobulin light chain junction region [Macaca mulatta]MPN95658.1 immunoglobulin light chain junction region [Macaca mulatta]